MWPLTIGEPFTCPGACQPRVIRAPGPTTTSSSPFVQGTNRSHEIRNEVVYPGLVVGKWARYWQKRQKLCLLYKGNTNIAYVSQERRHRKSMTHLSVYVQTSPTSVPSTPMTSMPFRNTPKYPIISAINMTASDGSIAWLEQGTSSAGLYTIR